MGARDREECKKAYPPVGRGNRKADSPPGSADTPQSLDRYAYVLNDPVNLVDPLGLEVECRSFPQALTGSIRDGLVERPAD